MNITEQNNLSLETAVDGLEPIALIIRPDFEEPGIHFFTPGNFSQQVALLRHDKGKKIVPHVHNLVVRQVLYTQEVLFIRSRLIRVDLYSSTRHFLCSKTLQSGDLILLCGGGHAVEMLEDTSMIEVKQGPYAARWLRRRDNFVRGVGLGCVAGIAGILVHSFTDFSLRMPANAAYLVALYALGLRVVGLRESRELDGRADGSGSWIGSGAGSMAGSRAGVGAEERASAGDAAREAARKALRRSRRAGVFKAVGLAAGLAALLFLVVKENMGFVWLGKYEAARARLAGEGRSLMSGFAELDRLLGKAARWSGNPRFFGEQGRLYIEMAIAENESEAPERRDAYLDRAEEAVRRRIERNPADAFAYYDMSRVYLLYNFPLLTYQDAARRYLRRALVFKPHDLFLNVEAVYKFGVMWDGLGDEEKAWMFGEMRSVWPVDEDRFYPGLVGRWQREVKDLDKLKEILRLDPEVWNRASRFFGK